MAYMQKTRNLKALNGYGSSRCSVVPLGSWVQNQQEKAGIRTSKSFYPWSSLVRWFHCASLTLTRSLLCPWTLQRSSTGVLEKHATFKHLRVLCYCRTPHL